MNSADICESSKLQHPSSREAPNSKLQFRLIGQPLRLNSQPPSADGPNAAFGVWCLKILWSLDVGAWSFRTKLFRRKPETIFLIGLLLTLVAFAALAEESAKAPDTLETLQQRINELVTNPRYAAGLFGVKIASLDSGKVIYEHDAGKLFSPASNSKLYTMALALARLGADYRIKTSLYAQSRPDDAGALKGDLIVYGRGDPTISGEYNQGNVLKALEPLVAALTNAGVKSIAGDLLGDDSYFRGPPFGSGWDWGDLDADYGAEISALTINSNTVQLVVKPGEPSARRRGWHSRRPPLISP